MSEPPTTYTFAPNTFRRGDVVIYAGDKIALTIKPDGIVLIGDGLRPDEAGRLAAETLARTFPIIVTEAVTAEREACASSIAHVRLSEVLLAAGEMTAQEKRTVAALLPWLANRIRNRG